MIRCLCVLLLACLAFSCESAETRPNGPSTPIDGTWSALAADLGGSGFPEAQRKTIRVVIHEGTYTVSEAGHLDRGIVVIDTTKVPMAMDVTMSTGPNKDKRIQAIYETTGDTLRVCYDLSGKTRPTAFKTEKGTQLLLVLYAREGY